MDLHIYDMKLEPGNVVILTGDIGKNEIQSFAGYMQVLRKIFPNPIIYIPSESTLDIFSEEEAIQMLEDVMSRDDLMMMYNLVSSALDDKTVEETNDAE